MTTHHNAAVWLDHHEARLIFVDADNADELTLRTPGHTVHRHPKDAPAAERDHPDDAHHFFRTLAHQLERAQRVLVVGPASAKLQFLRFLQKNDPVLAIVGAIASEPTRTHESAS